MSFGTKPPLSYSLRFEAEIQDLRHNYREYREVSYLTPATLSSRRSSCSSVPDPFTLDSAVLAGVKLEIERQHL